MTAPTKDEHFTGGFNQGGVTTHTFSETLGSTHTNELVLLNIAMEPNSSSNIHVTSITDSAGLTWTKYDGNSIVTNNSGAPNPNNDFLGIEVWWAYGTISSTAYTLTVNINIVSDNVAIDCTMWSGANGTTPFDPNVSLPVKGSFTNTSTTPSLTGISTTSTTPVVISLISAASNNFVSVAPTFAGGAADFDSNTQWSVGTNWCHIDVAGKAFSSAQSSITVAWSNAEFNHVFMAYALQPAGAGGNTGTIATNLTQASQSAAAAETFTGTIATNLTKASQSAIGPGLTITGTIATHLTKASQSASAAAIFTGTITTALSKVSQSLSADDGRFGPWASTEAKDAFRGATYQPPIGTWASTEAKDTFTTGAGTQRLEIEDAVVINGASGFNLTSGGYDRVMMLVVNTTVANGVDPSVVKPLTAITGSGTVGSTLTWKRQDLELSGPDDNGTVERTEVWWAYSHLPVNNEAFSYTFGSGTSSASVQAVGFTVRGINGNYANPFSDANPYSFGSNKGADFTTITTDGSENSYGWNGSGTSHTQTVAVGGSTQKRAMMLANFAFTSTTATPNSITSVTDSAGNAWQRYTTQSAGSGWNTAHTVNGAQKGFTVEIWYTNNALIGASLDVTANFDGTIDACVGCFSPKFLGCDPAAPFDTNASLPKVLRIDAGDASQSLAGISTTSTNNIYPVWCLGAWGLHGGTSNVSFNGVFRQFQTELQKNNSEFVYGQFAAGPAALGPYSGVSYSVVQSSDNTYVIGLALVATSPPVTQPKLQTPVATGPLSSSGGTTSNLAFDSATDNNVTLTGGGLVVTSSGTNSPDNWTTVASANEATPGRYYYEVTFNHIAGAKYGTGILFTGADGGPHPLIVAGYGGIALRGDGTIWAGGLQVGSLGVTPANGDVIGIAIDISPDTQDAIFWARDITQSGFYNGNPGSIPQYGWTDRTGYGGGILMDAVQIVELSGGGHLPAPIGGYAVPYAFPDGTSSSAQQAYNFGATSFVGTAPIGFVNWTSAVAPAVTPTRVAYHSVVVGWATSLMPGTPYNDISVPPTGYTMIGESTINTGGVAAALSVFAQVRATNILTTDDDLLTFPTGVKHWTVGYDELVVGAVDPGSWESTEAKDSFHAVGYPGSSGIIGDLLSTEAKDIFAATGEVPVVAVWTSTEAKDIAGFFGHIPVQGPWASTEAKDILHVVGNTPGTGGPWMSTENPDVFAGIGNTPISGVWASTEAADRFLALGAGVVRVRRRRNFSVT